MIIEILMSRRNNQGGCGRNEPSAPPIHMMPGNNPGSSNTNEPLYREPPPSYQEAIGDDTSLNQHRISSNLLDEPSRQGSSLSATANDRQRLPSPTYHRANIAPNSQNYNNDDYTNHTSSNRGRRQQEESQLPLQQHRSRQTGSLTGSIERLNGRNNTGNTTISRRGGGSGRYRSASPSELSEGAQDGSQERWSVNEPGKKKKGSGSKIKKGLENIAFFIIQILD